jgi:KTSC domain
VNSSPLLPTRIGQSAPSSADGRLLPDLVAVQSRLLASMAYDSHQAVLQIQFRGGIVYQYFHVPLQTYQDLLQADSKGAYFNRHVRSVFRYARLHSGALSIAPCSLSAVPS